MRKRDKLANPASCMNKAREDEMTFVLFGRDPAAPVVPRRSASQRFLTIGQSSTRLTSGPSS